MLQYPKINIRSKNELAKRLSFILPFEDALSLINDCLKNKDKYWHDNNKMSEPIKGKYVRAPSPKTLGSLLKLIDVSLLKPFDSFVAPYVYGGLKGRTNIQAAKKLINKKKNRYLLKVDLKTFFEQITQEQVEKLLSKRCGCSIKASKIISNLCCVPLGAKSKPQETSTVARGFATSSRLSMWCCYEFIVELNNFLCRELKNNDPRIVFYIDDIGIVASYVDEEFLEHLYIKIKKIAQKHGLTLNDSKKSITPPTQPQVHLGVGLSKNKISISDKSRSKRDRLKSSLKGINTKEERKKIKIKIRGISNYESQIKKENKKV